MFPIIFSWLVEQMPFLKENALGPNKATFIQNLLFSNCADFGLYKIYLQCKDPAFLGRVCKQNRVGRQAEDIVKTNLPRVRAVQETAVQGYWREPRQCRCGCGQVWGPVGAPGWLYL